MRGRNEEEGRGGCIRKKRGEGAQEGGKGDIRRRKRGRGSWLNKPSK